MGWRRIPNALVLTHVPFGRGKTTREDSPTGGDEAADPSEKTVHMADVVGRHEASAAGFKRAVRGSRTAAGARNSMPSPPTMTFDIKALAYSRAQSTIDSHRRAHASCARQQPMKKNRNAAGRE